MYQSVPWFCAIENYFFQLVDEEWCFGYDCCDWRKTAEWDDPFAISRFCNVHWDTFCQLLSVSRFCAVEKCCFGWWMQNNVPDLPAAIEEKLPNEWIFSLFLNYLTCTRESFFGRKILFWLAKEERCSGSVCCDWRKTAKWEGCFCYFLILWCAPRYLLSVPISV